MPKRRILYGVCGIGLGHTHRQLPIIEHLAAQGHEVLIFAYGESYKFYSELCLDMSSVDVQEVSVPFYVGARYGIDFDATANRYAAAGTDQLERNCWAMGRAQTFLGTPDLVISDYEPVSAQYAYAKNAPLVTIDQQSKYLLGDFDAALGGTTYADEVARLRMFFPRADARIACSFFRVPQNKTREHSEKVLLYPPILSESVLSMKRQVSTEPGRRSILVYISSQREFVQQISEVVAICASLPRTHFHLFLPAGQERLAEQRDVKNLSFYKRGDPRFSTVLQQCSGIVTTAGHTLLSEAMYLQIPVYAIPLPVYEQQMNAHVIGAHGFGISYPRLTKTKLAHFVRNIPVYEEAIRADKDVLLRGSGEKRIISYLERRFLS